LIIVDDVEHIHYSKMRNYLPHISSVFHSIPIICASTNPAAWAGGYREIVGSWTDYGILPTYTGERLRDLLVFFEMLLPFTKESGLFLAEGNVGTEAIDGPAKLIEKWTGGILRDVVRLLMQASRSAIEDDLPCISPQLLEEAWKELQTERVETFFYITPACQDKQPGPPLVTARMCLSSCDQVWATSGILAVGHCKLGACVEDLTEG
jgi:hypothetical protein